MHFAHSGNTCHGVKWRRCRHSSDSAHFFCFSSDTQSRISAAHVTVSHTYPSDRCRPMCCTFRGRDPHSSFCRALFSCSRFYCKSKMFPSDHECLCVRLSHSNDILQFDQPAVQHHLGVLHWGHLSSHDGLQHVSLQSSRLGQTDKLGGRSSAGAFRVIPPSSL